MLVSPLISESLQPSRSLSQMQPGGSLGLGQPKSSLSTTNLINHVKGAINKDTGLLTATMALTA